MGISLMICDQVITETETNKKSLIGVFNSISAGQFPCRHPKICINLRNYFPYRGKRAVNAGLHPITVVVALAP